MAPLTGAIFFIRTDENLLRLTDLNHLHSTLSFLTSFEGQWSDLCHRGGRGCFLAMMVHFLVFVSCTTQYSVD